MRGGVITIVSLLKTVIMKGFKTIHNMLKKILFTGLLFLFLLSFSHAQETWSLQKCIEYAGQNNLSMKQAEYSVKNAELLEKQARLSRMPGLAASIGAGMQFGRTIDPTTNDFDNQTISYNNYGINASLLLFDGGRINNTIKQNQILTEASKLDAETIFNNQALFIANAYLNILMADEQLENAKKRLAISEKQLEQTDKLIEAGTLPRNDRLEVVAQMARDEQTIVQSQNLVENGYLNLRQLLELSPEEDLKIEKPNFVIPTDVNPDDLSYEIIYSKALGTQPQVKADELRLKSADVGIDLAKSGFYPTVSIFGGISTNWSSLGKAIDGFSESVVEQQVFINGDPIIVGFPTTSFNFVDNPYMDQLDQNLGQNIGASINIPIYSRGVNKISVERAQLNALNSKVQSQQTLQQLKTDVQSAIANARASKRSMEASQKTQDAARAAFENADKRFELGAINTFQYTTAKNNLDMAEIDLVVAKYDYVFRLKILDFYSGKEIKMN